MAKKKDGITVTGVEVSRFHRLTFARVQYVPGQGIVRVTGKNGAGKTSLLRSIRSALGGAGEVLPEPVNSESEDGTGVIRLKLSNGFTVTRRFTEANPKGYLTVEGADGGKHSQGKLAEWLGPLSFDPLAFFDLKPDRQRTILLSLGGDPELPSKLDGLRRARAAKHEERTPWIATKRRAAQVVKPAGERPDPVDISAGLTRMGELQKVERECQDLIRETERKREAAQSQARETIAAGERVAEQAERVRVEAVRASELLTRDVERLRAQLAAAESFEKAALAQVVEASAETGKAIAAVKRLAGPEQAAATIPDPDLPPDPSDELEQVRARIADADKVQGALRPWEAWEQARKDQAEAVAAVDKITDEMGQLEVQEHRLIAGAGIPVDGLGFSPEGAPLLNGRPLEVASGGERIQLSVAVALAANPELRVCLIDEANELDLGSLQELDGLAKDHGFQVWAARIGIEGEGEIVVEEGVARAREEAAGEADD